MKFVVKAFALSTMRRASVELQVRTGNGASSKPSTTPSGEAASLASRERLTALGVAPVPSLVWKPTEVARQSATIRTVRLLVLTFLVCCPGEGTRCKQRKQGKN